MADLKLTLTFCGGTGTVTGANFLLDDGTTKILVDCGLEQGGRFVENHNHDPFPYNPRDIAALLVTHTHLDHIGRIPKLVKDGFNGPIFSTAPTRALAGIMLPDALSVMTQEAASGEEPLYSSADIEKALSLWREIPYHEVASLVGNFSVRLKNAGHILGSAIAEIQHGDRKIAFTGDLGNSPSPLLPDCETVTDADYIVMESVYGDRNHEGREERRDALEDAIEDTVRRGGELLIPAFSVERTQILLYEINNLVEESKIPMVPVFLDSPLAIKATAIYERFNSFLKDEARAQIEKGDDIFSFPQLFFTEKRKDSQRIWHTKGPKVIIAGSGMSMGGRVLSHERRILPDSKSTILLVGYQAPGTIGRRIQDGAKEISINGEKIAVRAKVASIHGYSAHKDSEGLIAFGEAASEKVKRVYVTMGEPKASTYLAQRLRDYVGVNAVVPTLGDTVELN